MNTKDIHTQDEAGAPLMRAKHINAKT